MKAAMRPFAAAPGTYLLSARLKRGRVVVERHIVVGWINVQGSLCFPLTAIASEGLGERKAVLHSTGEVSDLREIRTFERVEDWLECISPQLSESEPLSSSGNKPRKSRAKSGMQLPEDLESML